MTLLRRAFLPSTADLLAFEAAARHQSVSRAAEELHLTQSAVSRQIRQLEEQIGTALFHRVRQRVVPIREAKLIEMIRAGMADYHEAFGHGEEGSTNRAKFREAVANAAEAFVHRQLPDELREAVEAGTKSIHDALEHEKATSAKRAEMRMRSLGPDGKLYVSASAGQDKVSLYSYDLATGKLADKPLVTIADYDFRGSLIMDQHKLLGVRYAADAVDTVWLDEGMKAMQAKIDALLPQTTNLASLPDRPETPYVLVTSYSDQQPASYYIYDREKNKVDRVGTSHPKIDGGAMGKQAVVRYAARDGLQIPALLTLPPGRSKNLPLVVLVHGGPFVRGASWGWNPQTQFLATRGYAVLEPEFRGSTGLGEAHFRAGWKQWGLKMQDDIADGAKWAVAQGIADGKRICIAGASYGGYATLMGLINDHELYQCGVDWVGVTDLGLLYTARGKWNFRPDTPDEWKDYGLPQLVGDLDKDAAQLKATSPLQQAARIKRPLLMAYGGADRRVPIEHGSQMRDALKAAGQPVEWVEYPKEGHGWTLPQTSIDFWTRVERFLDKNIGPVKGSQ
eukprot:gene38391-47396_t